MHRGRGAMLGDVIPPQACCKLRMALGFSSGVCVLRLVWKQSLYLMLGCKKVRGAGGGRSCNFFPSFNVPYEGTSTCWCRIFIASETCLLSEGGLGYCVHWLLLIPPTSLHIPSQPLCWPLHKQTYARTRVISELRQHVFFPVLCGCLCYVRQWVDFYIDRSVIALV